MAAYRNISIKPPVTIVIVAVSVVVSANVSVTVQTPGFENVNALAPLPPEMSFHVVASSPESAGGSNLTAAIS